jgi:hypothetical protein
LSGAFQSGFSGGGKAIRAKLDMTQEEFADASVLEHFPINRKML